MVFFPSISIIKLHERRTTTPQWNLPTRYPAKSMPRWSLPRWSLPRRPKTTPWRSRKENHHHLPCPRLLMTTDCPSDRSSQCTKNSSLRIGARRFLVFIRFGMMTQKRRTPSPTRCHVYGGHPSGRRRTERSSEPSVVETNTSRVPLMALTHT